MVVDSIAAPAAPLIRRLAAYNLHQGAARAATAQLVADWQPDLLCLQEARDPALLPMLEGAPPRVAIWQPVPGGVWGSGLLLRAAAARPLPLPPDLLGWVAGAEVPAWGGPGAPPVCVFSVHAPPGPERSYARMVMRILDVAAEIAAGKDLVLGGDFNVVVGRRPPGGPIRMTRAEQAILDRMEYDLGLMACWQAAHPGEPLGRTLRWRHRADSLPYHCDGLFVPAGWRPALRDCTILTGGIWETASDHHPVLATFGWGVKRET